jgi:type I restriction enzyme S subunit
MGWQTKNLGDVVVLQRGYDLPEYERMTGDVPVYGSFGITGYHNVARAAGPGVTIGRSGASIGVVSYSEAPFWPHNATLFVTDFKGNDPRFISYLLRSIDFSNLNSGSAQPSLNRNYLYPLTVRVPDKATQLRIASILSAYDDSIENNTRRIRILEKMAQMLYREWFVNFRFPGHEKAKMVQSELGAIPSGWAAGQLGDIAQIEWGDTSVTKASYSTGGFRAFSASGPDGFMDYFDFDRTGIVLSAIGANCGLTWYASGKWSCIKNTICFWADEAKTTNEFLYFATKGKDFWPRRGSAQPFISQGDARAIKLVIPPQQLAKDYSEIAAPMISLGETLAAKNVNLRKTRSLLLPKLISGEMSVESPEIGTANQIQ